MNALNCVTTATSPTRQRGILALAVLISLSAAAKADDASPMPAEIQAIMQEFCFGCHGDGGSEGGLALDMLAQQPEPAQHLDEWLAVWKNLRAEMMPPFDEAQPTEAQRQQLIHWIEGAAFQIDPANPDPGRVTIRRLNREEYRNTIRDLLGVEFDTTEAFPADDTGYGFDTIGDVLSISPLLMEKYLEAAREIVAKAVPTEGPHIPTVTIRGEELRSRENRRRSGRYLPFSSADTIREDERIGYAGKHRITVEMSVRGSDEATSNSATVVLRVDDKELHRRKLGWDTSRRLTMTVETDLQPGEHDFALELIPGDPPKEGENELALSVRQIEIVGPLDGSKLIYPPQYERIFADGPPPEDPAEQTEYARKILRRLADGAFRRPVDEPTLDRLTEMAMTVARRKNRKFEDGIAHALTAILASPRFLFRAEIQPDPNDPNRIVRLDEFALASRLSYFLWSSMPDDELFRLAREGQLRANLRSQIDRMLQDEKSERFVRNFVGQWLQTRDVETLNIDARRILGVRSTDDANRVFNRSVRRAMRQETELMFAHLLKDNGSLLDLLNSDYTFLNEPLAEFYGIDGVEGDEMRKVSLSAEDHRGGLLTQGTFLIVTSNPTRTSPVKRGLFILDNILGTPAPPAPPDVPALEEVRGNRDRRMTMREMMEIHRQQPLCASCHARMDPLGLALENYNAIGQWRDSERGEPIDTAGQLLTGEKFANARELAEVLATERRRDFYRCVTEKLLTYAVGRGIEYYDAPSIDKIVAALEADGGRLRTLIYGIVESAPFQKRRGDGQ